ELADKLVEAFEGNAEWMAVEPLFEGPADQILEDLEENLKECAALLLVYGNSTPPWVRAQLRRYNKVEKSRKEPLRLKTIVLGPPAPKTERDLGASGRFTKLDCQNGFTTEHLHRILAELHRCRACCRPRIQGCARSGAPRLSCSSAATDASMSWSTGWLQPASSRCLALLGPASHR